MFRRYPSLLLLGTVLIGIVVADVMRFPSATFLLLSILTLIIALWLLSRSRSILTVLLLALSLGSATAAHFAHSTYDLSSRHVIRTVSDGQVVQIFGTVTDWPEIRGEHTEFLISVDSLGGTIRRGTVGQVLLKVTDTTTALQRSDRIELYGRIYPIQEASNSPTFDYGRYLNLKGVFGVVYLPTLLDVRVDQRNRYSFFAVIDWLRDYVRDLLHRDLSPETAGLAAGFLIGETRDISTAVYQSFRNSGTLHLMAVSGSNVAVVVIFFHLLLQPFNMSKARRSLLLLAVVVCFAAVSYGEPSVLRASVMASLVILANLVQRRYDLNNVIALTMLLILLWEPQQLYDVGFQLSFVTAWGLIFLVPRLTVLFKRYHNARWYRWIAFPLMISLVAQFCSAPLIAYYFDRIPLISPISNLFVVPLVSLTLALILALLLVHTVWPLLGLFAGRVIDALLIGTLKLVGFFGSDWLPTIEVDPHWPSFGLILVIAGYYVTLVLAVLAIRSRLYRRALVLASLGVANLSLLAFLQVQPDAASPHLHLTGVPGGVAGLVEHSGGRDLVLTGLADKPYDIDTKVLLPWLRSHGADQLDRVFVLSLAYGSVDDLLRLADSTNPSAVYVCADYEHQTREVIHAIRWPDSMAQRILFFGANPAAPPAPGLALDRDKIRLSKAQLSITFLSGRQVDDLDSLKHAGRHVLVLGKAWTAGPKWLALKRLGYSQIICPRIAQPTVREDRAGDLDQEIIPPDFVCELAREGEVEVQLAETSPVTSP